MNKQTKVAAPAQAPAQPAPATEPVAAPEVVTEEAPAEQSAKPALGQQQPQAQAVPDKNFANFQEMLAAVKEIQEGIVGKDRYSVETKSDNSGNQFTLKIAPPKPKITPASFTRPMKTASKILEANFPAEWLKSMGF